MASTTNRPLTVAALLASMFMAAMEATVVATAMPTVIAELGGINLYGWVSASYLLASTVSVPLYGKLADRSGRKPVLLIGIAVFLAGSLASGLAQNIEQLIAFRALQGLGAGAVQPIVLTIIGDLYTPAERGRVQGLFGAVWGIAGIAGPLLGAALVHAVSWRWVFLVNIPPGILSFAVLIGAYREDAREKSRSPLDVLGALAITAASLALLLAASQVAPWIMLAASGVFTWLFVWIERRAADPVLPLSLLSRRLIAVTTIASALFGAAMMGVLTFLPVHVQGVLGRAPVIAGATISPMLVGWPIASAITSRLLVRTGYRTPVWIGSAVIAVALVALAWLVVGGAGPVALGAVMCVFGMGMGLQVTAIVIGVQASVGWEQRGVATASNMFARTMGGALGVGALGAVLALRIGRTLPADVVGALLDPHRREEALRYPGVVEALGDALDPLFWAGGVVAVIGLLVVLAHPRDKRQPSEPVVPVIVAE